MGCACANTLCYMCLNHLFSSNTLCFGLFPLVKKLPQWIWHWIRYLTVYACYLCYRGIYSFIQFSRKLNSEYTMEIQIFICAMFNSALSAKYHARDLCFKVWYFRINILNKGDLACSMQPELLVPPQILNEHKISRNGVGRIFFLHDVAIDCFTVGFQCFQTVKNHAWISSMGTKLLRQASEEGLSMGPGCLSFREGFAAVVQLSLVYLCYHCYFAADWSQLHLGHSFSYI